jgi:hypothetical protein
LKRFAEVLQQLPILNLPAELTQGFKKQLRQSPVIVVDNVYDYLTAYTGKELPYMIAPPPFPLFWMEFKVTFGQGHTAYLGAAFMEMRWNEKWEINMAVFCHGSQEDFASCIATRTFSLDSKGNQIHEKERWNQIFPRKDQEMDAFWDHLYSITSPLLLAIMFMHSKSVKRVEHIPPAKLAKRNLERGKAPMLRYQTLEIEPMKEILLKEGHVDSVGLERALHLCRGHFNFYPDSGPGLFGKGKTFGLVWIPAHARGTEKKGMVISDYSVQAPPKEEAS